MKARRRIGLLLVCCLSSLPLARPQSKEPEPPSAPDFSQEPFVAELLRVSMRFESDGTGVKDILSRMRVQTDGGVQQVGQLVFEYNSDFERLAFKGRVIKPDGTRVEIPDGAIQDMSSPVSRIAPMYTDIRQKHVVVPGLRPGDIVEHELRFDQFAPMAPNQFWIMHDFTRAFIVKAEELRIDVPAARAVNVKSRPEFKPEVRDVEGRRVYTWKTANLERREEADFRKKGTRRREVEDPSVQLTTFRNWAEVGDWYAKLEGDRRTPDEAIRARVAELTRGLTDPLERLRALYQYVAQEYRYVSLSFGMGRYQPHAASEVFANQYGDCKDKNTLLAAMADVAGLRVRAALTSTVRKIDPDFPSPLQFNHVVSYLRLGEEDVWLDSTLELATFRTMLVRDKDALVVNGGGTSALRHIPAESAVLSAQVAAVDGAVDDLGALAADVQFAYSGDAALFGRLAARSVPKARWKDMTQSLASFMGIDGEISNAEIAPLTDVQKPLEHRFHIVKQNYFNRFVKDAKLTLPLCRLMLPNPDDLEDDAPIELGQGRFEYRARLRLPKQFVARLPLPVSVTRDYAQYSSRYALEDGALIAERRLEIKVAKLPFDRRNDFLAFRRAVLADIDQQVPVKVEGDVATQIPSVDDLDPLLDAAGDAYDNGDYRAAADILERVVQAAPDHKSAYNDLGRAYLELRQTDRAEAALKKATDLDPFSPYAFSNLGRVYWTERRYADAEKQFRKQIEIAPLDAWCHANLGQMLVDQAKYAEAEPMLHKAVALRPDDALSYRALGKAQLALKRADQAVASLERAVELDPSPRTWNSVAWTLAEHQTAMDRAQRYAESAVATLTSRLRDLRLDAVEVDDLEDVHTLAGSWDTLGWVYFKKGENSAALRYLNAAWQLSNDATAADHLGQLHERLGKRDLAIADYALAAAEFPPLARSRDRLKTLVGEVKAASQIRDAMQRLGDIRGYSVPAAQGNGTAEFFVALAPGPRVTEVRFIGGDGGLKRLAGALKSIRFKMDFPDQGDARVIRRGTLSCRPAANQTAGSCAFILLKPEDVHSVD